MAMSPGGTTEPENERSCKGAQCALQVQGAQCMEPGASSSASSEAPPPGRMAGGGTPRVHGAQCVIRQRVASRTGPVLGRGPFFREIWDHESMKYWRRSRLRTPSI